MGSSDRVRVAERLHSRVDKQHRTSAVRRREYSFHSLLQAWSDHPTRSASSSSSGALHYGFYHSRALNLFCSVIRNSTSYDRYWEGRKAFATITTLTRNFSRQVWIYANLPAPEDQPSGAKGKSSTHLTAASLRRRKIETIHLCLSFAYAAKHYLRGEDGVNYPDYIGVLPPSFAKYDSVQGYSVNARRNDSPGRNPGTRQGTVSSENPYGTESLVASGTVTPDTLRNDATKRVRAKRSKTVLPSEATPLLGASHRVVDFHTFGEESSMPLPVM